MDEFSFDHPRMLHLLWALPVLWGVYVWGAARKRQALERFATPNLLNTLVPAVSVRRQWVKALLTLAAVGMLAIAMAGPRWGTYYEEVPSRGIDILFVLDTSKSMLAEDVAPNRLGRAKIDVRDMLDVVAGDRVGLVTFAGKSTLSCPLTTNYGWFRMALDAVNANSTSRGGTNIGDAVRHAGNCFTDDLRDHKAIVVISDGGETEESYAVEASRGVFEEKGVRVFTVGFGKVQKGGRIPIVTDGQRTYLTHQGQEVWTKLTPTLLQSMAAVADGGYFSNVDFRVVYDNLRQRVAPHELEATHREGKHVRFPWFAGTALLLLMIETVTTDRKARTT